MFRCQSEKHREKGDSFCPGCVKRYGVGLVAPFFCYSCHPDKPLRAEAQKRTSKQRKPQTQAKSQTAPVKRHERLVALRKRLGLYQSDMAKYLGISYRQYQDWEYDDDTMPLTAKILCWRISLENTGAGADATAWPEGEQSHEALCEIDYTTTTTKKTGEQE